MHHTPMVGPLVAQGIEHSKYLVVVAAHDFDHVLSTQLLLNCGLGSIDDDVSLKAMDLPAVDGTVEDEKRPLHSWRARWMR